MPIRQKTTSSQLDFMIAARIKRLKQAIIKDLSHVGERVRNEAIENGSYTDRTSNLRSSVGYIIVADGNIVYESSFGRPEQATEEGRNAGLEYARSIAMEFPNDIVLIVVAGMKYAKYVSARGYDVLDSAELLAEKLISQLKNQLGL